MWASEIKCNNLESDLYDINAEYRGTCDKKKTLQELLKLIVESEKTCPKTYYDEMMIRFKDIANKWTLREQTDEFLCFKSESLKERLEKPCQQLS